MTKEEIFKKHFGEDFTPDESIYNSLVVRFIDKGNTYLFKTKIEHLNAEDEFKIFADRKTMETYFKMKVCYFYEKIKSGKIPENVRIF